MLLIYQNILLILNNRLGRSVQYEIQETLVDSSGIPEKEKQRVVSAHKSEYQHAVILDRQNKKRKREKQTQENSKKMPPKKNKNEIMIF